MAVGVGNSLNLSCVPLGFQSHPIEEELLYQKALHFRGFATKIYYCPCGYENLLVLVVFVDISLLVELVW